MSHGPTTEGLSREFCPIPMRVSNLPYHCPSKLAEGWPDKHQGAAASGVGQGLAGKEREGTFSGDDILIVHLDKSLGETQVSDKTYQMIA